MASFTRSHRALALPRSSRWSPGRTVTLPEIVAPVPLRAFAKSISWPREVSKTIEFKTRPGLDWMVT